MGGAVVIAVYDRSAGRWRAVSDSYRGPALVIRWASGPRPGAWCNPRAIFAARAGAVLAVAVRAGERWRWS